MAQQAPSNSAQLDVQQKPSAPTTRPIRLLTQNMWLINTLRGKMPPFKQERSHDFAQQMKHYDVICMQEVFSVGDFGLFFDSSFKEYFLQQGSSVGLKYAAMPPEVLCRMCYVMLLTANCNFFFCFTAMDWLSRLWSFNLVAVPNCTK